MKPEGILECSDPGFLSNELAQHGPGNDTGVTIEKSGRNIVTVVYG